MMPENASELVSAINWTTGKTLPLRVTAAEWIGVSHDTCQGMDIIHLFNYRNTACAGGITLEFAGKIKKAWSVSPDHEGKTIIPFTQEGVNTILKISDLEVYEIIVLQR